MAGGMTLVDVIEVDPQRLLSIGHPGHALGVGRDALKRVFKRLHFLGSSALLLLLLRPLLLLLPLFLLPLFLLLLLLVFLLRGEAKALEAPRKDFEFEHVTLMGRAVSLWVETLLEVGWKLPRVMGLKLKWRPLTGQHLGGTLCPPTTTLLREFTVKIHPCPQRAAKRVP